MTGSSSTGSSFSGLGGYLGQEQKAEWTETRNLPGRSHHEDLRLMEELAETSRAEQPVYHLSLNYADGDNPSRTQMVADGERVLEELGLADHQTVMVAHGDTDHTHLHLMVNRIHPDKPRAWNTWRDRTRVKDILGAIERDRGYQHVSAGREWEREAGLNLSQGELRQLRERGLERMPLAAKAQLYHLDERIQDAGSWDQLQGQLGELNLEVRPKGRGGVIADQATGKTLKLSRIHREHSFGKLQERFGRFAEYQQSLARGKEAAQALQGHIRSKSIRQAFGKAVQARAFGSKGAARAAGKQFRSAMKSGLKHGFEAKSAVKAFSALTGKSNPLGAVAKLGKKIGKRIGASLQQEQEHGMGRSLY